jgi:Cu/Ag efflux pump CusA
VRLGDVADVRVTRSRTVIKRDAVSRKIDITADVSGRSVSAVADDLEKRVAAVKLPLEYHAEVLDHTVADEVNAGQVIAFASGALVVILLLLQAAFRSWRVAVPAFLALPVALTGGVVGALLVGGELTIGTSAGLLALLVLAARSALTLIRRFQDLEREGDAFGPELVQRGAQQRLAPSVTSLAAIGAAMLPFVVMGSPAGLEIVHPMAVVVLCGLVTLAALSLFVVPALYLRFAAGRDRPAVLGDEDFGLPLFAAEAKDDSTGVAR